MTVMILIPHDTPPGTVKGDDVEFWGEDYLDGNSPLGLLEVTNQPPALPTAGKWRDPLADDLAAFLAQTERKSYSKPHKGRPGQVGGSAPRDTTPIDELPPEQVKKMPMAELIARMRRENAAHEKYMADLIAEHETKYGKDTPMVLRYEQPEVVRRPWYGVVIHPSAKLPDRLQVTYFDQRGFSSDFSVKDRAEALREIGVHVNKTWHLVSPNFLDEIAMTPDFQAGNEATMQLNRKENHLSLLADEITPASKGQGRGYWAPHAGRPDKRGGSAPRDAASLADNRVIGTVEGYPIVAVEHFDENERYTQPNKAVSVSLRGPHTGIILSGPERLAHSRMIALLGDDTMDNYVRFGWSKTDQALFIHSSFAATSDASSAEAIDNIYKALNRLYAAGVPANLQVIIGRPRPLETIYTTVKSLGGEKSYPAPHEGRHGKRGGSAPRGTPDLEQRLLDLRPALAQAAQEVYDEWQPDPDEGDPELGFGGICDRIATAMGSAIGSKLQGVDITDGGQEGDDHAYIIAFTKDKAYAVDIPPSTYERGGGYEWQKLEGVKFTPEDIVIEQVDRQYIDGGENDG